MTAEHARRRARELRQLAIRMGRLAADRDISEGVRYHAAILKEEAEDAAARFEAYGASAD
jgi:hypothetical protein